MFSYHDKQLAVLLLVITLNLVHGSSNDQKNKTEALFKRIVSSMQIPWINGVDSFIRSSETSCSKEIRATLAAITDQQTWPLQMIDASSKIQSGILNGNIKDLGTFDQCIGVNEEYNNIVIRGQHCMISYSNLSSSVCVPSSCTETEIIDFIGGIFQNVPIISDLGLEISEVLCAQIPSANFTIGEIITITFFSAVAGFIIFCTICDLIKRGIPGKWSPTMNGLTTFSLYTNATKIMSTKTSPQMMPAIQGIRFLSMCWVVYGHSFFNAFSLPQVNAVEAMAWYNSWVAVYIQTAPFAVDSFFVVSGFLMSYLYLKSKQSGKRSNFHMMYIHRYLRLTPCIAVLMLFVAVLLHRVANGPVWETVLRTYVRRCQKNWWINLLYIQNFVDVNSMCLGHAWYLAVDMQLFLISPIILYPLFHWPKFGVGLLGCFLIASMAVPGVVLAIGRYSTAVWRTSVPTADTYNDLYYFYIPTYNRACAYFVGILLGYDLANKKRRLTQVNVAINWILAFLLLLVCLPATHYSYSANFEYNLVVETVFAVILRPIWSIAIAWIIYACTQGYGGIVNSFLSLPIFLPLSRLSYCIYLVHMVIEAAKTSALHVPGRFTDFILLNIFWADLGLSILVAFIFTLFFESPVVILEKMLTNRGGGRNRSSPTQEPKKDLEHGIDNKGLTET